MPNWWATAAGFGAFLAASVAALATTPPYVFAAGFVGGAVAAFLASGGVRSGLWHGFLAGLGQFLAVLGLVALIVVTYRSEYTYPGYGFGLVFLFVLGVVYVVQAMIAGTVLGIATR